MNNTLRQILGFWLVCALLIAAAIPAGFMPNIHRTASADGTMYPLVLCTAYGEKTVYVPAHQSPEAPADAGQQPDSGHDDTAHSPCPYAPTLAQHLPQTAGLDAAFIYHDAAVMPRAADRVASAAHKNWHAQAPPLS